MIGKGFRWPGGAPRQGTKHIHVRDFGQSSNSKFSDVLGGHGYGSLLDRGSNRLERAECTRVRLLRDDTLARREWMTAIAPIGKLFDGGRASLFAPY